jgi:hypothetical protein
VKHDPFAYFANVQAGTDSRSSLNNIAGFGGRNGSFCSGWFEVDVVDKQGKLIAKARKQLYIRRKRDRSFS